MKAMVRFARYLMVGSLLMLTALQGFAATHVVYIPINNYDSALTPRGHGQILTLASAEKYYRYPSWKQNMQFILFFNTNSTTGFYVQTEDASGAAVDWDIIPHNGVKTLRLSFHTATMPNIVQETITIDPAKPHLAAAERYKTWAFQQFWAKRKISKLDSVKFIALGASKNYDWLINPLTGDLPPLLEEFEEPNTTIDNPATATWLTLWRSDDFNVNFPRYTPEAPVNGHSFASLLSSLHARGSIPLPYVNAELWDTRMLQPDSDPAHDYSADHMVKNSLGAIEFYDTVNLPYLVYACPATSLWQDFIPEIRSNMLSSSNIMSAGIYYDMVASAQPLFCFNSAHTAAHAAGDPLIWQQSHRAILANTPGVVMIEGSAEVYIDLADVFLMHEESELTDNVPLWNSVYGTISRIAGWNVNASDRDVTSIVATLKRAKSFGSRTWGSPWLALKDTGLALDYQRRVRSAGYEAALDMLKAAPVILEDGASADNWSATGNVSSVWDVQYGKNVIELNNTGVAFTAPEWTYSGLTNARWSIKRTNADPMFSGFKVSTVSGKTVYLYYTNAPVTAAPVHTVDANAREYIYHGIGIAPSLNGWQTIDRDLEADLRNVLPGETISQVRQLIIFNDAGRIADVKLFPRL